VNDSNPESRTDSTKSDKSPVPDVNEAVPFEFRLLTKPQTAAYFGVEVRTIEKWMQKRRLPYRKIAGTVRFLVSDLLKHLDSECLVPAKRRR